MKPSAEYSGKIDCTGFFSMAEKPVLIQWTLIGFEALLERKFGSWKENEVADFVVFSQ